MTILRTRFLIVDDDYSARSLLNRMLNSVSPGSTVLSAKDAPSALEILSEQSVDLILTDYEMPLMNGFEFIQQVRQQTSTLPILLMTVHDGIDHLAQRKHVKFDAFLQKPIEMDLLTVTLARLLPHAIPSTRLDAATARSGSPAKNHRPKPKPVHARPFATASLMVPADS